MFRNKSEFSTINQKSAIHCRPKRSTKIFTIPKKSSLQKSRKYGKIFSSIVHSIEISFYFCNPTSMITKSTLRRRKNSHSLVFKFYDQNTLWKLEGILDNSQQTKKRPTALGVGRELPRNGRFVRRAKYAEAVTATNAPHVMAFKLSTDFGLQDSSLAAAICCHQFWDGPHQIWKKKKTRLWVDNFAFGWQVWPIRLIQLDGKSNLANWASPMSMCGKWLFHWFNTVRASAHHKPVIKWWCQWT